MRARYRARAAPTALVAIASLAATVACGAAPGSRATASPSSPAASPASPVASAVPSPTRRSDPAAVKANELGVVPVLMYHQVVAAPQGKYDQTPAQLRAELTRMYRQGYRTVTAASLVSGRIDVPAGKSPMVLTFDDGTASQYGELPDGSVDPGSAVGVLLSVAKAYGEPHPVATFYVNAEPFAGRVRYLRKLHALGMELGDHTLSHANLAQLTDAEVQAEIAKGLTYLRRSVPGVEVTTMALPFGMHPRRRSLASRGTSGATSYRFAGVMLVGAGPAPSPYSASFRPLEVPRLLSGRDKSEPFAATFWLNRIGATRYVSDGDPDRISFPKAAAGQLAARFRSRARPY